MSIDLKIPHIVSILGTLENLMIPGFGPNSLNTMLSTSTGQLMVTSDAYSILESLNLSHPVGKMIVESVKKQAVTTGDGGKTMLLILAQLFREIETSQHSYDESYHRIHLVKGLSELKHELPRLMEPLKKHCKAFDLNTDIKLIRQECSSLVLTRLQGLFPLSTVQHLVDLIDNFLFKGIQSATDLLAVTLDSCRNFNELYVEAVGYPVTSSRILSGFVIQRDFHSLNPVLFSKTSLKVIIFGCGLDGDDDNDEGTVFTTKSHQSLQNALLFKVQTVDKIMNFIKDCGVSLVICTGKLSLSVTSAGQALGISMVQMADEDEVTRLSHILGVHIVYSLADLFVDTSLYIGKTGRCDTVMVSGYRYVHLVINDDDSNFRGSSNGQIFVGKQFLISGHSRGACCQVRMAIKGCLTLLHSWLTSTTLCDIGVGNERPDEVKQSIVHSIVGGGAFELYFHHKLKELAKNDSESLSLVCELLSKALLSIPLQLLRNSYHPHAEKMNMINVLELNNHTGTDISAVNGRSGLKMDFKSTNIRESLAAKVTMLQNLLDLTLQILKVDKIVSVSRLESS